MEILDGLIFYDNYCDTQDIDGFDDNHSRCVLKFANIIIAGVETLKVTITIIAGLTSNNLKTL